MGIRLSKSIVFENYRLRKFEVAKLLISRYQNYFQKQINIYVIVYVEILSGSDKMADVIKKRVSIVHLASKTLTYIVDIVFILFFLYIKIPAYYFGNLS